LCDPFHEELAATTVARAAPRSYGSRPFVCPVAHPGVRRNLPPSHSSFSFCHNPACVKMRAPPRPLFPSAFCDGNASPITSFFVDLMLRRSAPCARALRREPRRKPAARGFVFVRSHAFKFCGFPRSHQLCFFFHQTSTPPVDQHFPFAFFSEDPRARVCARSEDPPRHVSPAGRWTRAVLQHFGLGVPAPSLSHTSSVIRLTLCASILRSMSHTKKYRKSMPMTA